MKSRTITIAFALLVIASMILSACAPAEPERIVETVIVTEVITEEGEERVVTQIVEVTREVTPVPQQVDVPVTLNWNYGSEPPTLDPALATDTTSVDVIRNLFISVTQFHPETGDVEPYLATDWEQGEDEEGNTTFTFNLRDDVPWVHYNPVADEWTQITDDEGNPRFVNAHDVVYGVKRTIDPETGSNYAYVLYSLKNAAPINSGDEGFTIDDLGVEALDDYTVQYTLEYAASYFPSIAGLWVANPMPQWAIEEHGDRWTESGFINTNGPMGLESWIHGAELNLVKSPLWIDADSVQIERVEGVMIVEASTAFALYENNELDTVGVPLPEIDRVKADPVLSEEFYNAPAACTYYYGFTNNKPPMDDIRVRQAFVQSIDRQSLIDNVLKGGQIPATSFAPPGIFGAPEPGTVGLPYDPDAARAALEDYLDENGMTIADFNAMGVVLMHNTSEGHALIAAAIQQMWSDVLGVTVQVENQEWQVYLDTIEPDTPLADAPHIWRLGWCADYADENNWVHEVFNAEEGNNDLRRNCLDDTCTQVEPSEFDELTKAAAIEPDPDVRAELYEEAERILAAEEVAYAPIYHYTSVQVTKPWLERNYPLLGGNDFFNWTIDMDAKVDARGF